MQLQARPCPNPAILNTNSLHPTPLIHRILATRGLQSSDDLQFSLRQLHPVSTLAGVQQAAQLLAQAITEQRTILIVGDYDADGATATAVTVRALRMMGHQAVHFLVPDRFKYGYGLTPDIVKLAEAFQPWLLMTVDNGVSSIEGVAAAKALGYKTLITDHHLPGEHLPDSDVMVNPNQPGDTFPSKMLAGVGVVFYVMLALKQALLKRNYFAQNGLAEPNLTRLLGLVALGTVADVVPLDANNRILVEQGLRRIRAGQCQAGIQALLQSAGRKPQRVVSNDFGYACGPRLNAAGRLSDMSIGIRCLLTDDWQEALQLATQLNQLNNERKRIEADMKDDAEQIILSLGFDNHSSDLPPIMCLHQADWHEGVIGILASRIKERYYRPTIVFANAEDGLVKGSARCIEGLHMRDLIDEVATLNPGMISRFGGHAMAAGLSLPAHRLDDFSKAITHAVKRHLKPDTFNEVLFTDGELSPEDMTLEIAEQLRDIAPWGQWFPEPQFSGYFRIHQLRILKDVHVKAELFPLKQVNGLTGNMSNTISHIDGNIDAIDFFADLASWPAMGEVVHLLYRLNVNEFRGKRSLQLMVEQVLEPH
ncbi:MAG: single-stranded-DNA-specific exonuclease RecJ [Proteobacteria bacterium]|nr:MAG: single-stranded-DNA-specific exonuclease RecJ [Pseudomonadota bacterium]